MVIKMIRQMFKDMPILISIGAISILGYILLVTDPLILVSNPELFSGIVVDKHYKAEENSTGMGYGMTISGNNGLFVTSEYESERFFLMVKVESGEVVTVDCDPTLYYKKAVGEKIDFNVHRGFFTGQTYSIHGVR